MAKVYHQEIYGSREAKYDWLNNHNISNVEWEKLEPQGEYYLFKPLDAKLLAEYHSFYKITEIFPINSVGVVTARDKFVIDFDRSKLEQRVRQFIDPIVNDEILKHTYNLSENRTWKIEEQRKKLRKDLNWKDSIIKILYRPFDERWIFYHDEMVERTRSETIRHMLQNNVALITSRIIKGDIFGHCLISENISDGALLASNTASSSYIFPLYIYPETDKKDLFSKHEPGDKKPNIKPEIFAELKNNFQKDVSPEEIFYYIYAVLYSNIYREKYKEFLKIDFPRIPFTKDYDRFINLSELGKRLADLHLLKSRELDESISKFPIAGSNKVETVRYLNDIVWINKTQYFDVISAEVWQYQIGGFQVCNKWLKDRKGRTLSVEEIRTYCKIVTALSKTIALQNEIDTYFEY